MGKKDPRVDEYIDKAAPFAQPILLHIRELIHRGCPEVEETIKWRFPVFEYKGMLANMAGHKQHCSFSFWKGSIMNDPEGLLDDIGETSMGHFGKLKDVMDLPSDETFLAYIKEAVRLNDEGIKAPTKDKPKAKKELEVPDYLLEALEKNEKAKATFEGFSYSNKKEYVEWLTSAKTEKTRLKRLETAIEWMAEGKIRNWKYVK